MFRLCLSAFAALSISAAEAPSPAPTPDQERQLLKDVKVPDEFEAKIFAVPPAVNYPVFVAATVDGTVYVSSDKNGSLDRGPHRGRVLRVRDLDGNGHADEVKPFVPDIDSPRGLVWDRDRLYLLHPPHLSAFIDHDGNGMADEQKTLIKNLAFTFKDRPADHSSNGIEIGVDGWIYCAIGDFGFLEAEGTDGRKLQLRGGGVLRVRPDGTGMELYSTGTRNILEACVSPLLDVFARDNTNDGDGWDIRLHHFTGLSEHGYPSLYKNFKGEFVEPLADYGGGSGCGGMYMSEPGFPEGYGEALYTADWGREWVYRHRLTGKGATFSADQSEFVRAPRVTDLDVDGQGRIYVASWKGASFTYVGENVGFLLRVTAKSNHFVQPLPNFRNASERELVSLLESPSHRRRLEAQRELLAGPLTLIPEIQAIAQDPAKNLHRRVAALFLLKQKLGTASHEFLLNLMDDPTIQAWAIRALCDTGGVVPSEKIVAALRSPDARVRREAAFGLARIEPGGVQVLNLPLVDKAAAPVAALLGDPDPVVRHTAIRALQKREVFQPCFTVLASPGSSELERNGAMQVLQALHKPIVVRRLILELNKSAPNIRRHFITALARLYYRDGEWKGDSWGTRPDTSGPYYQPVTWDESVVIAAALKNELKNAAGEGAAFIARELGRYKIQDSEILETVVHLASRDQTLAPVAIAQLARADEIPPAAMPLLLRANSPSAVIALAKVNDPQAALAMLRAMASAENSGREFNQARQALLRSKNSKALLSTYASEAAKLRHGEVSAWADAVLLSNSESKELIDKGWSEPARRAQILRAIALAEHRGSRERVLQALEDSDPAVVEAARKTARALRLDRQQKPKTPEPTIADLKTDEVLQRVASLKGDRKLGEEIFTRQACNTCHTVSASEALRGPFLGNIATIYKRDELATAILLPNKSLAQGFAGYHFELNDETEVDGFVIQESASKVTIRNVAAQEIAIATADIAKRTKLEKSLMPEGLAANLSLREFASLLDYLQGLAAEAQ